MAIPRLCLFTLLLTLFMGMNQRALGFDAQGHRGARGLVAENTLHSFAKALVVGVNTLELDVGISRDHEVMVTHNPNLEPEITKDSDGNWLTQTGAAVHALTLDKLKTFDVGGINPNTRYHERFPDQARIPGAKMPTLGEVIALVKRSGSDQVSLNIETKIKPTDTHLFASPEEFVTAILKVLDTHDFLHRVTIQSFDWRTLQLVQELQPNIPTSYLTVQQKWMDNIHADTPGASPWTANHDIDDYDGSLPKIIKAAGGDIWSAYHRDVSAQSIAEAHDLGLTVKVWTVNDPTRMQALLEMGVDGIITDYPDRLVEVMQQAGLPLPPRYTVSP